jgi:hypothetical protein
MKTVEEIIKGLKEDISISEKKLKAMAPNAYLNGDNIVTEQAKITYASNLIKWIEK